MHVRLLPIVVVAAVVMSACGSTAEPTATGSSPTPRPTTEPTPESRGWIGGEPDWFAAGDEAADDGGMALSAAGEAAVGATAYASGPDADRLSPAAERETTDTGGEVAPSEPPSGPLTGGSIDDNDNFDDYLAYRDRVLGLGIPVRDLDPEGRVVVRVRGANGLPLAGVDVTFGGAGGLTTLRTTADGTVRFHPLAYAAGDGPYTVTAAEVSVEAAPGDDVIIDAPVDGGAGDPVPLDVQFLLDATGSMADEIDQLKATIGTVASRIDELPGTPDVRLGMTLYRDRGDSFVTSTFDLTGDIAAFSEALDAVVADGGGDYPEALDEALAAALAEPTWRAPESTVQLVFLVADAPPQIERDVRRPYTDSMLDAVDRGIKILPVSSSGTDDQAEFVFRQLAQFTGGRYVFLTYGAGGKATGPATDITAVDYEELALDDLIVRLVAEELAELTGDPEVVPPPEPTPTPDGGQNGN